MTSAIKSVNYTAEQTATVVNLFKTGTTVEVIAEQVGRSVRSVIAKLSAEKVYTSPAKASAGTRSTKAQMISAIAVKFGVDASELESLEKANRDVLEILAGEVAQFVEQVTQADVVSAEATSYDLFLAE